MTNSPLALIASSPALRGYIKSIAAALAILSTLPIFAAGKGSVPLPTAPSGLIATAISSNQIQLAWQDNSTNESSFKIERAPTSSGSWKQIATVSADVTTYINSGLTPSTAYYYRVRAYNARGNSGYTAVANATTLSPISCTYAISPGSSAVSAAGGTGSFSVTATSGCSWSATPSVSWITVTSGSGTGNGLVNYSVASNGNSSSRTGTITVAGQTYQITQDATAPCVYACLPVNASYAAQGGSSSVNVTAGAGCSWNAAANAGWLSVLSGNSGTGNGSVNYSVAANSTTVSRTGTLTIAGQPFTVTQDGVVAAPSLSQALDNPSLTFSTGGNANWTIDSNVFFAGGSSVQSGTITDGQTSWLETAITGPGTLSFYWKVSSETGYDILRFYIDGVEQTGSISGEVDWQQKTFSIGSGNHTVRWAYTKDPTCCAAGQDHAWVDQVQLSTLSCSYALGSAGFNHGAGSESGSFGVISSTGCSWTASTAYNWIHTTSSGNGNGTVTYTVDANSTINSRTGSIVVGGQTFTVNQSGVACTYSLSSSSASFNAAFSGGSVNVTAPAGCAWSSSTIFPWLHVSSTGNGNGVASYTVDANTSSLSRSGTLTIAGQTFTVNQAGVACTVSINPGSASYPAAGGSGTVGVTAPTGCGWLVSSGAGWVTVSSGPSGSGNGTVSYSVAANSTTNSRSASIAIDGQTFTVNQAGATPCNYTITTTPSPTGFGTSSGGGVVSCGSTVVVTATANAGYNFVNWTESGNVVSTSSSYSFVAAANRSLVANFAACTYAINASVSGAGGGTVSGAGNVSCGSTVTVSANASSCYQFVNWTENGLVVSSSSSYTFTANSSRTLVANFSLVSYSIAVAGSPSGSGTTSGGGTVNCGSTVTVNATPASCYRFVNWTEAGLSVSTSASYTFTAGGNRSLVANFALLTYTISGSASPSVGGSVSGNGTFNCGSTATLTATPASCYTFVNWTENGVVVSSSSVLSFSVSANRTLVANFRLNTETVATSSSPAAGGSTTGAGTFNCGSTVTVVASPASGYSFVNWTENGVVAGASASYSFTAAANRSLVANFSAVPCTFSLSANSSSFGAAGGSGNVNVSASASTCAWGASTSYGWIHTTSSGTGSGTASFSVDANGSATSRTGSLTIAGQTFTITQSGHAAPGAYAGPNQSVGVGTAVTFNGAGSTTSDGATITSYSWSFGDLGSASGAVVSHSYSAAGTFVTTLTVSDSFGASSSAYASVTVTNPVTLSVNLTAPTTGSTVSSVVPLTASASATATRVDFYCDSVATPLGSATAVPFTFRCDTTTMANGSHTFYCKAYDVAGNFATSPSVTVTVNNQTLPGTPWAKSFGSAGNESGTAIAVDASGNTYFAGYFTGSADFGGGLLTSAGGYDLVLAKYSASGAHIWSKRFGSSGNELPTSIALDAAGNIFIAGSFYGTANFGGADLTSAGDADAFVAKFSPTGAPVWSQRFGANFPDVIKSIAVDSQGNVVAAGFFQGTVAVGATTIYSWGTGIDPFLAKFSNDGANLWVKNFYNAGTEYGNSVAIDKRTNPLTGQPYDNIVLAGYFNGYINFSGGQVDANLLNTPGGYLAKFSPTGALIWSKAYGGINGSTRFWSMAIDGNGDVAVGGDFPLQTDLGGGLINGASWGVDLVVAKFSGTDGAYRWATPVLGFQASVARPTGMTVDTQNNIIMTGFLQGSYSFGAQSLASAPGVQDGLVAKFSTSGAAVWAQGFGATSSANGNAVAVDSTGHPVATGYFSGTANCAGQSLTCVGGIDLLLLKLNP